jgi:hypothetical protein
MLRVLLLHLTLIQGIKVTTNEETGFRQYLTCLNQLQSHSTACVLIVLLHCLLHEDGQETCDSHVLGRNNHTLKGG